MRYKTLLIAAAFLAQSTTGHARNIVISNDDGLTSNVMELYRVLKAKGHDVIVSVPCVNQSGMGAALKIMRPLGPLAADCRAGAARAGAPGAGPMERDGLGTDFFYVDGTPVMSLLYGLDIAAKTRWGRAPDLVFSGPNEGANLGQLVLSSGTVSNAQVAATRGIPAIASSGPESAKDDVTLRDIRSAAMASRLDRLLETLERSSKGKRLLPEGVALNVNFPDSPGTAPWRLTRIGTYNLYTAEFVVDIGGGLPGVTIKPNAERPLVAQTNDEAARYHEAATVSVMQTGYDASPSSVRSVERVLVDMIR